MAYVNFILYKYTCSNCKISLNNPDFSGEEQQVKANVLQSFYPTSFKGWAWTESTLEPEWRMQVSEYFIIYAK